MEKTVPHFFKEIKEKTKLQFIPFNDLYFSYLIFFVFIIGGAGIWICIIQEINNPSFSVKNLTINISTYCLALITTSYIDLITNEKIINRKSLHIYCFIFLFIIIAILTSTFLLPSFYPLIPSVIVIILALFVWHLANCENDKFNDESYNAKIKAEAKEKHGEKW